MSTDDGRRDAEPIDVEFEEARAPRYRRRSSGGLDFGSALVLAILAAGAGAAGGAFAPRIPQVRAAMDQVLPDPAAARTTPNGVAAVDQRLRRIEGIMDTPLAEAASAGDVTGANVAARVFQVQSGLADVQRQLQQIPSASQVAGLTAEVQRMQQELPAIEASARTAQEAARAAFAVAAASDASRTSGPFEQSYASLQALLPNDPNVAALAPLARTGAPTRNELRDQFDTIQIDIIRAARSSQAGAGFWGRIQAALAQWVVVRRRGEGDTPAGIVERADARLAAEDLQGAIAQVSRLSGPAAQVAAPWLRNARRRNEIDTRFVAIRAELSRRS